MLSQFVLDLGGRCSHFVFVDDDRDNFPPGEAARASSGVQPRDAWELVADGRGVTAPNATLVAWPAGESEGGSGLDAASMKGIAELILGA